MATRYEVKLRAPTVYLALQAFEGTDLRWPLECKLTSTAGTEVAMDVTGATWLLNISDKAGGTVILTGAAVTAWADTGVYVVTAASGYIDLIACAADLAALTVGTTYWYDLKITTPASQDYIPSWTGVLWRGPFDYLVTA